MAKRVGKLAVLRGIVDVARESQVHEDAMKRTVEIEGVIYDTADWKLLAHSPAPAPRPPLSEVKRRAALIGNRAKMARSRQVREKLLAWVRHAAGPVRCRDAAKVIRLSEPATFTHLRVLVEQNALARRGVRYVAAEINQEAGSAGAISS